MTEKSAQKFELESKAEEQAVLPQAVLHPDAFDSILRYARDIYRSTDSKISFVRLVVILYTALLIGCSPVIQDSRVSATGTAPTAASSETPPQTESETEQPLLELPEITSTADLEGVLAFREYVYHLVPPESFLNEVTQRLTC